MPSYLKKEKDIKSEKPIKTEKEVKKVQKEHIVDLEKDQKNSDCRISL